MCSNNKQYIKTKPAKNLVGMRFGKLIVEQCLIASKGDVNDRGLWYCKCDCGKTVEVKGVCLRSKSGRQSCGCLRSISMQKAAHNKRLPNTATITKQYLTHKHTATRKGFIPLLKEDWLKIVSQKCYYCGEIDIRSSLVAAVRNNERECYYTEEDIKKYDKEINGVDRIDSTRGYELDNCRSCCTQCNTLKMDYTEQEFFEKISVINNRHSYSDVSLESLLCN